MIANVGTTDKYFRIIIGLILISLIFWGPETYWGLLGIIPLATAFINWCPLYLPFGISTRKLMKKD